MKGAWVFVLLILYGGGPADDLSVNPGGTVTQVYTVPRLEGPGGCRELRDKTVERANNLLKSAKDKNASAGFLISQCAPAVFQGVDAKPKGQDRLPQLNRQKQVPELKGIQNF